MSRSMRQAGARIACWLPLLLASSCRPAAESQGPAPEVMTTKTGAAMVLVPAGTFVMGSDAGKPEEAPAHQVGLDAFWIDRTEVTQQQYGALVLANPSHFQSPARPAEQISWADAARYCNERSRDEGLEPCYDEETAECNFAASGYRLPTEAEWEYACLAGMSADGPSAADARALKQRAWYADNSSKKTQPVAGRKPNDWGLHDMLGNVAEWCNDMYRADYYAQSPGQNPQGPGDGGEVRSARRRLELERGELPADGTRRGGSRFSGRMLCARRDRFPLRAPRESGVGQARATGCEPSGCRGVDPRCDVLSDVDLCPVFRRRLRGVCGRQGHPACACRGCWPLLTSSMAGSAPCTSCGSCWPRSSITWPYSECPKADARAAGSWSAW